MLGGTNSQLNSANRIEPPVFPALRNRLVFVCLGFVFFDGVSVMVCFLIHGNISNVGVRKS